MANQLGEKIKQYIRQAGSTQQELASELGITAGGLTHKLAGKNPWYLHQLSIAAEFLGLNRSQEQELFDLARRIGAITDDYANPSSEDPLLGANHPLARHMRVQQFKSLIEDRTRSFVGRTYVVEQIDEYLRETSVGGRYIVIRGEPGIGKTALMAQLVKERAYVHHFNVASQNIRSPQVFLANVCAQLIVRYGLNHFTFPPDALQDSGFLSQLLREAAEKEADKPIVVVVDALDEADNAGLAPGNNPLYLPALLPKGVFFIVTAREKEADRLSVHGRRDIYLRDTDPQNMADVRRYIELFLQDHQVQMSSAIPDWGVDESEFVDVMADKSQGNFMYLVYVLNDIRDGFLTAATVDSIQNLPTGLRAYYEQHWDRMRMVDSDRFDRFYEPVVCVLAAAREPVTDLQVTE